MTKYKLTTSTDLLTEQDAEWQKIRQPHLEKRHANRKPRQLKSAVRKFIAGIDADHKKFIHAIEKDE